jgi:hypothetical protein
MFDQKFVDTVHWKFFSEDLEGNSFNANIKLPFDASWSEVLERFVLFLSTVYGYDISQKMQQEPITPFTQR